MERDTESPIDVVGINEAAALPFNLVSFHQKSHLLTKNTPWNLWFAKTNFEFKMGQVPYPLQFNSFLPPNRLFKKNWEYEQYMYQIAIT